MIVRDGCFSETLVARSITQSRLSSLSIHTIRFIVVIEGLVRESSA
jgi:hypothetical protein